jgi:hypothetical protein
MSHFISTTDENTVNEGTSQGKGLLNLNSIINIFLKGTHNYFFEPQNIKPK